ncbi:MAG: ShlB/FhaC/HecB family hemolysin secretion/activation protein [Planctomycetota bacterium]
MEKIKILMPWILGISLAVLAISTAAEKPVQQFEQQRELEQAAKREAAEAAKAKKEEQRQMARQLAEARQQAKADIEQAKRQRNEKLAELDRNVPAEELQMRQEQIEAQFNEQLAKIDMKVRLTTAKQQLAQVKLPEDNSARLTLKEIRFTGNTLVSTAQILKDMPIIFNSSARPLAEAESESLYDFTPVYETILSPGTSREVSARTVQGLTQYVLSIYQQKNYAGIYVYVPAEVLKGGKLADEVLPVEIIEAKVTDVGVTQYDANQVEVSKGYLDPNAVLSWSPVKEGQVANRKKLDDFVNLLNLNPDRYASAMVSKGSEPKTLAVEYDIYEVNPWHWFLQVDNAGTKERRWSPRVGVINTNLLGIDDTFVGMYQASPESDIGDNYALFGNYDFPLWGPKLRLNIYGGYSEFDISSQASGIDFLGSGKYIGAKLRYNVLQTDGWFVDFVGSYSHEESKITPSLFPEFLASNVKMDLWGWAVEVHKRDDIANSEIGYSEVYNINGLGSDDAEYALARPGGLIDNDFSIHTLWGNHSRLLDPNKVTRISGTIRWIIPSERLVPAKMTSFGGMYSVRGYEEYDVIADGGVLASVQYEFDIIKYKQAQLASLEMNEIRQQREAWEIKKFAPLVFFDYGRTTIKDPASSEKGHQTLASVGPGLLVEVGDNFSGSLYYGFPLKETDNTDKGEGRLNVGLMMRW